MSGDPKLQSATSAMAAASLVGGASSSASSLKDTPSPLSTLLGRTAPSSAAAAAGSSAPLVGGAGTATTIKGTPSQYVKLNVGGCLYYTTIATLTKHDTMLRAMFSGRMEVLTDSEGWIMIDRCGKHFGTLLNFLRDGNVCLPETKRELCDLQAEAKYFCITELAEAAEKSLKNLKEKESSDVTPICRVPLITSQKEEEALIAANTTRPVVKLLINRHNNKFSYTGASDDNILKNIELFDKLSLRFSNRVLFIKDVIGSNEICCWTFYGHGTKIAEVCCTALVYATERKNTKVEFPEARIYEETLNCLLYENRNGPDQELMQATSTRATSYKSDDEEERNKAPGGHSGGAAGGAENGAAGGASGGAAGGSGGHGRGFLRSRPSKNN